jgi:hypothetical protein
MSPRGQSRVLAILALSLLASCGLFDDDDRAPWRAQAEAACFARGMVKLSPVIQASSKVKGKGACGLDRPLTVTALADGSVRIGGRPLTMSCPVTAALEAWVRDSVLPAAYQYYGMPVIELKSMGTYNCRTRNNRSGARLSEHAFANAIDIAGFVLADGRSISVLKGWRGTAEERNFLRSVHVGACGPFTTVLGPGSDGLHENHLHLDLARHNAQGTYRYCKPKLEMPAPGSMMMAGAPQGAAMSTPPGLPQQWPRVLPQSIDAANAPLPPASIPNAPIAPAPTAASVTGPAMMDPSMAGAPGSMADPDHGPASAPAVNCPPGYVCAPAPSQWQEPPPVGWQIGPQPVTIDDYLGALGYSDE